MRTRSAAESSGPLTARDPRVIDHSIFEVCGRIRTTPILVLTGPHREEPHHAGLTRPENTRSLCHRDSGVPAIRGRRRDPIPAFVGYTERADVAGRPAFNTPIPINSIDEYHTFFGGPPKPTFRFDDGSELDFDVRFPDIDVAGEAKNETPTK